MQDRQQRSAFTLLEVSLSMGILIVGLTSIVSVYMLTLSWVDEIRINLTALKTGRIVLYDAGVLMDDEGTRLTFNNLDAEAKGWVNNYFVVRTVDVASQQTLPNNAGSYVDVHVTVYAGGNDDDGTLTHEIFSKQFVNGDYGP